MVEDSITCDVNGEVREAYDERFSFLCFDIVSLLLDRL